MDRNFAVQNRKGVTLIELVLIVMIIGILAYIAVPRFNFALITQYNADTLARKIVTDLRRTRSLAISDAAVNTNGYKLEFTGSSPYSSYRIVNQQTSNIVETFSVPTGISVTTIGGTIFRFGPSGNLLQAGTKIRVAAQGSTFDMSVVTATGAIKCTRL